MTSDLNKIGCLLCEADTPHICNDCLEAVKNMKNNDPDFKIRSFYFEDIKITFCEIEFQDMIGTLEIHFVDEAMIKTRVYPGTPIWDFTRDVPEDWPREWRNY